MEKAILFRRHDGFSGGFEERLENCNINYGVVESGVNFDLGNQELPAIFYSGNYYSGEKGFKEFRNALLRDLENFAYGIIENL